MPVENPKCVACKKPLGGDVFAARRVANLSPQDRDDLITVRVVHSEDLTDEDAQFCNGHCLIWHLLCRVVGGAIGRAPGEAH